MLKSVRSFLRPCCDLYACVYINIYIWTHTHSHLCICAWAPSTSAPSMSLSKSLSAYINCPHCARIRVGIHISVCLLSLSTCVRPTGEPQLQAGHGAPELGGHPRASLFLAEMTTAHIYSSATEGKAGQDHSRCWVSGELQNGGGGRGRGWTWHTCGGAPGRALQGRCSQRAAEAAARSPGADDHWVEESRLHAGGFWRASAYLQSREAAVQLQCISCPQISMLLNQPVRPLFLAVFLRFEHVSSEPLGL